MASSLVHAAWTSQWRKSSSAASQFPKKDTDFAIHQLSPSTNILIKHWMVAGSRCRVYRGEIVEDRWPRRSGVPKTVPLLSDFSDVLPVLKMPPRKPSPLERRDRRPVNGKGLTDAIGARLIGRALY
jgi:hypothetical protein